MTNELLTTACNMRITVNKEGEYYGEKGDGDQPISGAWCCLKNIPLDGERSCNAVIKEFCLMSEIVKSG